jgi:hypothetical protein
MLRPLEQGEVASDLFSFVPASRSREIARFTLAAPTSGFSSPVPGE